MGRLVPERKNIPDFGSLSVQAVRLVKPVHYY